MTITTNSTKSRTAMNNTLLTMLIDFYLADMQRRGNADGIPAAVRPPCPGARRHLVPGEDARERTCYANGVSAGLEEDQVPVRQRMKGLQDLGLGYVKDRRDLLVGGRLALVGKEPDALLRSTYPTPCLINLATGSTTRPPACQPGSRFLGTPEAVALFPAGQW